MASNKPWSYCGPRVGCSTTTAPALSLTTKGAALPFLAVLDFGSALQILVIASQLALFLLFESYGLCRRMAEENFSFLFVSCGQVVAIGNARIALSTD
jgi:hypothetical protein